MALPSSLPVRASQSEPVIWSSTAVAMRKSATRSDCRRSTSYQVVQDETVAARKGIDETRRVIATAHRQRCELQPSRPAFRPRIEGQDVVRAEVQTHELVEEGLGLGGGEAQVGRPHLDQV